MAKTKGIKPLLIKVGVALAIAAIVLVISQEFLVSIGPLKQLEQKHIDERFFQRGVINIKDTAKVVIVEITQVTYDGIPYKWPWPRSVYAKVIRNLNKAGVKAIGIDIVMAQPDQYGAANDSDMANAIREFRNVVVAGKIDNNAGNISVMTMNNGANVGLESVGYTVTKKNENFNNVYFPYDSSIGIVQVFNDNDGVLRRYWSSSYTGNSDFKVPSFAFAVLNKYFKLPSLHAAEETDDYFILSGIKIPRFDREAMLLNFYGPSNTFKYFNFLDVLDDAEFKTKDEIDFGTDINTWDDPVNGYLQSGIFKDKIVLIGSTLPEDRDIIPTSFAKGIQKGDNLMNGVEIHATAVQNILSQNFIKKEPVSTEIAVVILLSLFGFFISSFFKEIKIRFSFLLEIVNILIIAAALFGIRILSFYLFFEHNYLFSLMSANMAIILAYIGSTAYHFITERRQKGMIKGMFTQYVNAAIVDELIADPEKMKLGGQRMNLSVFFSDIAGFSTFSENKEPEDLVSFLNEYLSEMTKVVFENKGTLDKYVGDAVMAFWGAPLPIENHAYYACKSALEMQAQLVVLKERWKKEGQPMINARMGINTGDMVVGNVGGKQRFDYTVMGDAVNLASRLEGANKQYGTLIMISESTYEIVKDQFITRELDNLTVKGKNKPVVVYELIDYATATLPAEKQQALGYYAEGLALYKQLKFQEAIEKFALAVKTDPEESPSQVYIKRCEMLIANPPAPDWDGVFHMTTK